MPVDVREELCRDFAIPVMATGPGALVGVVAGAVVMLALPLVSRVSGYLYPAIGIAACYAVGLGASLVLPARRRDLTGLTVFTQASLPAAGRGPTSG